jgi:hypothetical protein
MPHGSQRQRELVVMIVRLFAQNEAGKVVGRSPAMPLIGNRQSQPRHDGRGKQHFGKVGGANRIVEHDPTIVDVLYSFQKYFSVAHDYASPNRP